MKKYDARVVGILSTVIIHLIAGILFMSFKISKINKEVPHQFQMEIVPDEPTPESKKLVELPETSVERILKADNEYVNIAKNIANAPEEKIDPSEYIDNVKDELIKSGKLGVNNYIDEKKNAAAQSKTDSQGEIADTSKKENKAKPEAERKSAVNFKGATRIYYDLPGRHHVYLPLPIYKCQGAGKIVLNIEISQTGDVTKALIIAEESTTSDECLMETAVNTALISRFNSDINAPRIQKGQLTYIFVAQ